MKKIFQIIILSVFFANTFAQTYDFDEVERKRMAAAKVKTQTQYTHDYENGAPKAKGYKSAVTEFNNAGYPTKITNFNEEGKIISTITYQYDSRNNRVKYERHQGDREKLQYSQTTTYDANNNKTKESGFDGASMYANMYSYNSNGKVSEIVYMVNNLVVEKRVMVYSPNHTLIQIFNNAGNLIFTQENTYDSKDRLIAEVKKNQSGAHVHSIDYEYTTSNNLRKEDKKRADEKTEYIKIYTYNNEGKPVKEETINSDGNKFVSHEYEYLNGDLSFESWRKNQRAKAPSTKKITYASDGTYTETTCFFASYNLYSLYKYTYEKR